MLSGWQFLCGTICETTSGTRGLERTPILLFLQIGLSFLMICYVGSYFGESSYKPSDSGAG